MNDEQIIQLYWQRNENAIAETSKKHGAVCKKTASNILSNPQDIDECISDTLFRAWNTIPPRTSFKSRSLSYHDYTQYCIG